MKHEKTLAYLAIIGKALIYGLSILWLGRVLERMGVFDVLALRFCISAFVVILLQRVGILKIRFKGKNMWPLLLAALFEPAGYFVFETLGIEKTTTLMAGIVLSLMPIFAVLAERLVLKEKTSVIQKLFLAFGVAGAMIIVLSSSAGEGNNELWGILFLCLAMLCGSFFLTFSRRASSQFTTMEITYVMCIAGAVLFNSINFVLKLLRGDLNRYFEPFFDPPILLGLLFLGIFSSIAATGMNNYALSKLQASQVAALGGLSTVVTVAAGVIVNGEVLTMYHVAGTLLILAGGIGVNYFRTRV